MRFRVTKAAFTFLDFLRPWRKKGGIRVIIYHGIVERKSDPLMERNFQVLEDFKSQLRRLRKYRVLSLPELVDELRAPTQESRPAAVITFDDGHANNLLAAEVLAAYRLPWGLFIPTGAVGRENFVWTSELSLLLLYGEAVQLEFLDKVWSLKERDERESAYQVIRRALKAMPAALRKNALNLLRKQFPPGETLRLLDEFPSLRMLSWEEISHLRSSGVEIGSHGVDHEIHHVNQPQAVRWFELTRSKTVLEERFAGPCRFFSYPNGDFVETSVDEVRSAGYDLAFTTESGVANALTNPYLLPRINPPELFTS